MGHTVNVEVVRGEGDTNEKMIKRFLKKCRKEGIVREVMDRRYHKKPSIKSREKREAARRRKLSEERKEAMQERKAVRDERRQQKEERSYKEQLKDVKKQIKEGDEVKNNKEEQ